MNLPLINTDNIGNSYFGWRTNNLIYAPDSVGLTNTQCADWINGFFGQTCAIEDPRNVAGLYLILPNSFETLSLPVTSSNYRFDNNGINSNNNSNSPTNVPHADFLGIILIQLSQPSADRVFYCCLNNRSLSIFSIQRNGSNLFNSTYGFVSYGWLSNPIYTGNTYPRNAYSLFLGSRFLSPDLTRRFAARPSAENSPVRQDFQIPTETTADSIANYPVSCQTATPGANTTELYLRDNTSPHKAMGYVPNLLKTNLQIPVGQVYRNTGIDPDGSNMNTWICVGVFGSERILMRVWTQGLD
jgi:hypothetical protein